MPKTAVADIIIPTEFENMQSSGQQNWPLLDSAESLNQRRHSVQRLRLKAILSWIFRTHL